MEKEREMLQNQQDEMQGETTDLDGYNEKYDFVLDVTTVPKSETMLMTLLSPVKGVLHPIQVQLRRLVVAFRISNSVFQWEGKLDFALWFCIY